METGAAGNDHDMDLRVGDPARHDGTHQVHIVRQDAPGDQLVAGFDNAVFKELAGGILVWATGVRDGEDRDVEGLEFAGWVAAHRDATPYGKCQC